MSKKGCTKKSGSCTSCKSACEHKPGWLKPGEAERIAAHLGFTLEQLFTERLTVDWWQGGCVNGGDIYLLSPAIVEAPPGTEFPADPHGTCVFYQDGQCSIHQVKPFECAESVPCNPSSGTNLHKECADAWNTEEHQKQIAYLLGREPESAEYYGGDRG